MTIKAVCVLQGESVKGTVHFEQAVNLVHEQEKTSESNFYVFPANHLFALIRFRLERFLPFNAIQKNSTLYLIYLKFF